MTSTRAERLAEQPAGPGLLDALSLLSEVADELVVRTARDTHFAVADRVQVLTRRGGPRSVPDGVHRGIAAAVYGGLSLGLRAASAGLDKVAATGTGPRLEGGARGRFVSSAVNGLIGDRLVRERPQLAIPMAVRAHGGDVPPRPGRARRRLPRRLGTGRGLPARPVRERVLLEPRPRASAARRTARRSPADGWTPVFLRANTGLGLRENGVALSALLQRLVDDWPTPVERIALVGHSMGGLIIRAGGAVATEADRPWTRAGLRRDHARHAPPGRPDRPRHRARQPGHVACCPRRRPSAGSSTGARSACTTWSPDSPRTCRRFRTPATAWSPRRVTTSPRHPVGHVRRRLAGAGPLGVRPGSLGRPAVPRRGRPARRPDRPLRPAQPSRRAPRAAQVAR